MTARPSQASTLASRSLVMAALLAGPALFACWSEWEYHEQIVGGYYDGNGCAVDVYETWYTRSSGGQPIDGDWNNLTPFEVETTDTETHESAPHDCPSNPEPPEDPDPTPPPPDPSEPPECISECETCEGVNPFRVVDGDVTRRIMDLAVLGAAKGRLVWSREHHTVPREGVYYFGVGGSWRHSWQFDLIVLPTTASEPRAMMLVYPTGAQRIFRQAANGTWAPAERFEEQLVATADGFEITAPKGEKLRFVENTTPGAPHRYEMQAYTDPYGLVTRLEYGANGWLSRVTEPAGRWLQIEYSSTEFQRGVWHELGKIERAPAAGQWVELTVSAGAAAKRFQHLRLRGARDGEPIAIAEIEYLAPGSRSPLRGTASGTGANPEAASDGDAATAFSGNRASSNVFGLDLGTGRQAAIGRVRVLAAAGREQTLAGAFVEGLELVSTVRPAVAKVTGSDGRSVSYDYALMADPVTHHEFLTLQAVRYGDGTRATYRYGWPRANTRPLLVEADDPRYSGPAKRIRYAYHDDLGVVHQEINPATGAAYVSLEFDPKDRQHRIVRYSDLREIHYRVAKDRLAVEERVDSLGRRKRVEYDAAKRAAAVIDYKGNRTERAQENNGRVVVRRRNGKVDHQVKKDGRGRVVESMDRYGRVTKYDRNAQGRIVRQQLPDGLTREYAYDDLGRVVKFVDKYGGTHRFTYDEAGLKETWTNPDGGVTRYGHDRHGRLISVTDPLGATSTREYGERGLVTKLIHRDGTTESFTYDAYGRRTSATDRQGRTTRWTYDEMSRMTKQVNPNGDTTLFDYSDLPQGCSSCAITNRPSRITGADGRVTEMLYDSEGRILAKTVAVGTEVSATTTYNYDADDNVTSVTDPLGRVTRFTYDDEHHRLTQADPMGRVTKWTYDERGNVLTVTSPNGAVTGRAYDDAGHLVCRTDALGNIIRFEYDKIGNLATLIDALGRKTRHMYSGKRRTATVLPDGTRETRDYDPLGRVVKHVSADGLETTFTYDAVGRVLTQTSRTKDGLSATMTYTYDALGRRASATDPLGRTTGWTYDALGNVLTITRPDGLARSNTFDASGRRTAATDEAGNTTRFEYDDPGDRVALVDAKGNTYRFTYDALHRKTSMIYPDGSTEKWAYDLAGQLVAFTNRSGQVKTVAYNAAGQPLSETWSNSGSGRAPSTLLPGRVAYEYDSFGLLVGLDNGNAKLTYTYDASGRMKTETSDLSSLVPGLAPQTVGYGFDALGRRADLEYPDHSKITYGYDSRGRLTTIDDREQGRGAGRPLARYAFDPFGRVESLTRDNGVVSTYRFDMAGQLTAIDHTHGSDVLASSHYTLDAIGRRTAQTREDDVTEKYGYDSIGQLTSVDYGTGVSETFSYDPVGNRVEVGRVAPDTTPTAENYATNNLNQYTRIDQSPPAPRSLLLQYDSNGNLTDDGRQTYRYDARNRLIGVERAGTDGAASPARAEFYYDAQNRCILRKYYTRTDDGRWALVPAESRALTYDGNWNLIFERATDGGRTGEYVHGFRTDEVVFAGLRAPSTEIESSHIEFRTLYPLSNGIGSTIALADTGGNAVGRYMYDAYGQPTAIGKALYRFLFTGREWLGLVGLSDHRNRYYSPTLGRWLSPDPIRHAGGTNLFAYVANDPLRHVDSSGLYFGCNEFTGEGVAAVIAAGLYDAATAGQNAVQAEACMGSLPGTWGGEADAVRHCAWSCLMSQSIGYNDAMDILNNHEEYCPPPNMPCAPNGYASVNIWKIMDANMDKHNNEYGAAKGTLSGINSFFTERSG